MKGLSTVVASTILVLAAIAAAARSGAGQPQPDGGLFPPSPAPLLRASLAQIPLHIIENRGVHPEPVRFYVQGKDKSIFFAPDGITFVLQGEGQGWAVKLEFVGANPHVRLNGDDQRRAVFSYFQGPRDNWKTGLKTFDRVVYEELWPGIDLVYRVEVGALKYEFRVKPGADSGRIRLRYSGATSVRVTAQGALRVETPAAVFEDAPPVAWVDAKDGSRTPVEVRYAVAPGTAAAPTVGFEVGAYRSDRELVIDPAVFVYCGYIGGSGSDKPYGVAVDSQGNAYLAGLTTGPSPTFPVKVGPSTTYSGGMYSGFVAKVDATGTNLIYCGYFGGSCGDWPTGIAVDAAGCAYLVGTACSTETSFPVTVGPDLTFNGQSDCYVAKVNAAGTGLDYCGYLGGYEKDVGSAIAVDASGCAYVTGYTSSHDASYSPPGTPFPTTVGPDLTHNGPASVWDNDAFVAKLDRTGTKWLYCGYIGGTTMDIAAAVAVDTHGCAYVVGYTASTESSFPVIAGPQLTSNGGDGFVAKVNAVGTGLEYCGYIGGSGGWDELNAVAVDAWGRASVAGYTLSPANTLPLAVGPGLQRGTSPWGDALVAKVSSSGASLLYCGLIAGDGGVSASGIALDGQGHAYVTGCTSSSAQTFPVKRGPQLATPGGQEAFVAKVDTTGRFLHYCGYIGGAAYDQATGIAVTPSGDAFVTGFTRSSESTFPVRVGPDLTYNFGGDDGFIAEVALSLLQVSGAPRPGGTVALTATEDAGLPYQFGSSLGTGPIPIDSRHVDLSLDPLLTVSVGGFWPSVFTGYRGVINSTGEAQAAIRIPNLPALIGTRIHSAFVTLHPQAPSGIRLISTTETVMITT